MLQLLTKKYKSATDEDLMEWVMIGNEKALEELYMRYSKNMLYFFYERLYRDTEKAQDFLQDLFLRIIEKSRLYDSDKKFKVWMYAIAANMCKNEYRKSKVRGTQVKDFDFTVLPEDLPTIHMPDRLDRSLFSQRLIAELDRLEESHSMTFILRYKEHLSVKEISQVMECSEGTVKSRIFYTIKKLSGKLEMFNPYKEVK